MGEYRFVETTPAGTLVIDDTEVAAHIILWGSAAGFTVSFDSGLLFTTRRMYRFTNHSSEPIDFENFDASITATLLSGHVLQATNTDLTSEASDWQLKQYPLLYGRAGGQTLIGGTAAGEDLTLSSTAHGTKGSILFGTSAYDEVNNRLGIGIAAPTDRLNAVAPASGGAASLGVELLLNPTFDTDLLNWTVGANWAWGAGGTADHTAGSVETLTQTIATAVGSHYQIVVILSSVTASNVVMTLTGSTAYETFTLSAAATYTYSFKAGGVASTLTFTPNTAFIGSITSVSFKLITPASVYALATMDSGGARSGLCSVAVG